MGVRNILMPTFNPKVKLLFKLIGYDGSIEESNDHGEPRHELFQSHGYSAKNENVCWE